MQRKFIPKQKLFLFSVIIFILFFSFAELSARLVLSYKKHSFDYIFYGLKDIREKQRLQIFTGKEGEREYYKSTPSVDKKNPVNSLGFRGFEIHDKKPGTIRIVCLGSSTTYGTGLDYDDTYPALLQKKLNEASGGGRFEVINAGQPGLDLPQIISLVKHEIPPLHPDVILFMNINNNLKAPGFWFIDIKGKENKNQPTQRETVKPLIKVKDFIVRHVALACLIQESVYSNGIDQYFITFDWKSFSRALMASDNIWEKEFSENLDTVLKILLNINPHMRIFLLGEAVNRIKCSEMEAPFNKAKEIMRAKSASYPNVYSLDLESSIIQAAINGKNVWQNPSYDSLHLVRAGNEIIADLLILYLSTSPKP